MVLLKLTPMVTMLTWIHVLLLIDAAIGLTAARAAKTKEGVDTTG